MGGCPMPNYATISNHINQDQVPHQHRTLRHCLCPSGFIQFPQIPDTRLRHLVDANDSSRTDKFESTSNLICQLAQGTSRPGVFPIGKVLWPLAEDESPAFVR